MIQYAYYRMHIHCVCVCVCVFTKVLKVVKFRPRYSSRLDFCSKHVFLIRKKTLKNLKAILYDQEIKSGNNVDTSSQLLIK